MPAKPNPFAMEISKIPTLSRENIAWFMYVYKTKSCDNTDFHPQDKCPFFHNFDDRRRNPLTYSYSGRPCTRVNASGRAVESAWGDPAVCPFGDRCKQCHTWQEMFYHPDTYKTRQCAGYVRVCKFFVQCKHFHATSERRRRGIERDARELFRRATPPDIMFRSDLYKRDLLTRQQANQQNRNPNNNRLQPGGRGGPGLGIQKQVSNQPRFPNNNRLQPAGRGGPGPGPPKQVSNQRGGRQFTEILRDRPKVNGFGSVNGSFQQNNKGRGGVWDNNNPRIDNRQPYELYKRDLRRDSLRRIGSSWDNDPRHANQRPSENQRKLSKEKRKKSKRKSKKSEQRRDYNWTEPTPGGPGWVEPSDVVKQSENDEKQCNSNDQLLPERKPQPKQREDHDPSEWTTVTKGKKSDHREKPKVEPVRRRKVEQLIPEDILNSI
eukprot:169076_1